MGESARPRCSANSTLEAAAWCSVCGLPFAGRFLATRVDGRAVCRACAEREGLDLWVDPAAEVPASRALPDFRSLLLQVVMLPARPAPVLVEGDWASALRAGYGYTVLGYVCTLGWTYALAWDRVVEELREQAGDVVDPAVAAWAPWVVLPVVAGIRLMAGAGALHLGARWAAGAGAGSWPVHARFWGLTSVTLLLCVIPSFGPLLSMLVWSMATMAMLRERYAVSTGRAMVAMLPAMVVVLLLGPLAAI